MKKSRATIVGMINGYPTVVPIIRQALVSHIWWWWHMVHRAAQLLLIEDERSPVQKQGAESIQDNARSRI
jgi:hypothetical protein